VPETYIATLDDDEGTEYVVGLQAIPQERWELVRASITNAFERI